jgi:GDPmannose 4,6-dehydratase
LDKGYSVAGLLNGQKMGIGDDFKLSYPDVQLYSGDLTDFSSLLQTINTFQPDEIYNLAALSHVGFSFSQPENTANVTGLGALRLLEAVRKVGGSQAIRFYQASSSEMFGKVRETPQKETTSFYPRSPYGVAKTFAHYTTVNYREAYGMHASSGILFNHEGPYRGYEFVTRKITSNVARIVTGKIDRFALGDITPKRDWGYAGDYVQAMWLMLQQPNPEDYVIATGETHTVREFLQRTLEVAGLSKDFEQYVEYDSSLVRPSEVDLLIGDASKAKSKLGWEPTVKFDDLVSIMFENDLKIESQKIN